MRPSRLIKLRVALAVLVAPLSLVTAQSASAADVPTYQTRIVWQMSTHLTRYLNTFSVTGHTEIYDASTATWQAFPSESDVGDTGQVVLQRRPAGSTTWTWAGKATDPSDIRLTGLKAVGNASYRLVYSGFAWPDSTSPTMDLSPATSSTGSLKVMRQLGDYGKKANGRLYIRGNVNPGWAHRPVVVQRKKCGSCAWRYYSKVVTSGTGAFSARVAAPRKGSWFYRASVAPTTQFARSWTRHTYRVYTL